MPHILDCARKESRLIYRLRIPAGLVFFQGHFPGFPILPGVVQIDWAVSLGRSLIDPAAPFRAMQRVKFMRPITGDSELDLLIGAEREGRTLTFRYCDGGRIYSSGRLLFGR